MSNKMKFTKDEFWLLALSFLFFLILIFQWRLATYDNIHSKNQLASNDDVERVLQQNKIMSGEEKTYKIPTGIEVFTFEFKNPYRVHLSGLIWQVYSSDIPEEIRQGVSFPQSIGTSKLDLQFSEKRDGKEVKGWRFTVTIREKFFYESYPFDDKNIWLRIWPKSWHENIVLVPDFQSYKDTSVGALFGFATSMETAPYVIRDSYFEYSFPKYRTEFGLGHVGEVLHSPELHYNLEVRRKIFDPIVSSVVPLFAVWIALYAFIFILTSTVLLNMGGFITSSVGLIFATGLLYGRFRARIVGAPPTYLDYLYTCTYLIIVTCIVLLLYTGYKNSNIEELKKDPRRFMRIYYWPVLLLVVNVITYLTVYG